MTVSEFTDGHGKVDFISEVNIITKVFENYFGDKTELLLDMSDVEFNGTGILRCYWYDLAVLAPY